MRHVICTEQEEKVEGLSGGKKQSGWKGSSHGSGQGRLS